MIVSFGSVFGANVLGMVGGFVCGLACPGVVRRVRAFVFGAAKKAEVVVGAVKSDVKKL